jgi:alpha-methylacyl-CoA racemase
MTDRLRGPEVRTTMAHTERMNAGGPLTGIRIIEIAGLGAGPFCGMMLADMGADVIRVDRPTAPGNGGVLGRNRRSIALDLKADAGRSLLFELIRRADGLVEAFRPGVAERLGFGPEACQAENPRLVFGRATGWGQEGPWRMMAGHDINYIALSGVLSMIGPEGGAPVPPLNLVGDFGGGGLLLAFGMVCALLESRTSGVGQVVDGAMVDGSALLATMFFEMSGRGRWSEDRGTNVLDGGAPYYDTYETADGKWVAIGAVESQFWEALVELLDIDALDLPDKADVAAWPLLRTRIAAAIATRTRDEWGELVAGTDACLAPILTPGEVHHHPHHRARESFIMVGDTLQPAPAPRFSRTAPHPPTPAPDHGSNAREVLADWGLTQTETDAYEEIGAFGDGR